ncbi:hypothetical protein [Bradyrhizobium sp. Gha]|uniref:hypothetical protein n=1 Tax=Bradyrhizobium sp. Gha TaxID=1855318 RepID=UPI0008F378AA|nr:hypothetical protein [Bradyrhizobium sp. Gha]SFJ85314.1 hypothetical protein SAMN05216525_13912 [Bradyrhizobium sp. Gha]
MLLFNYQFRRVVRGDEYLASVTNECAHVGESDATQIIAPASWPAGQTLCWDCRMRKFEPPDSPEKGGANGHSQPFCARDSFALVVSIDKPTLAARSRRTGAINMVAILVNAPEHSFAKPERF